MVRGSILLLEKNQKIIKTVEIIARRTGFKFDSVQWASGLTKYLEKRSVDIILMNARQSDVSIRDICTRLRAQPQFSRFPLIILYGKNISHQRIEFLKWGADDLIEMPFTPIDLMNLIKARLRPFRDLRLSAKGLSRVDQAGVQSDDHPSVSQLHDRDAFENFPLMQAYSRIFFNRQTGILTLIIKKETKSIYFDDGVIVYIESMSRKDDLAEFMARHGAGSGVGKDIIAARTQAGGPGCNPLSMRRILDESGILDVPSFNWWVSMYVFDQAADLISKTFGTWQWERIPIPEYAKTPDFQAVFVPHAIFEGVRRITKWWAHREKLPSESTVPFLASRFTEYAEPYGLTNQEITLLQVIDGSRTLKEIRELCHRIAKNIDNYLYACDALHLIKFEEELAEKPLNEIDIDEPVVSEKLVPKRTESPDKRTRTDAGFVPPAPIQPEKKADVVSDPAPARTVTRRSRMAIPEFKEETRPTVDKEMELKEGDLATLPVPELFRLCLEKKFSGCIHFSNLGITKQVFWRRGRILTALSDDIDERLDNFLYRKHKITAEQREVLRNSDSKNIGSPNEILKHKFLNLEEVFKMVKELIIAIIRDLISWTSGSFKIVPDEKSPPDAVPMDISPEAILMNEIREMKRWDHLKKYIPKADDRIVKNRNRQTNQAVLKLTPAELRILSVLAEPLPASEIIRRVGLDEDMINKCLYAMELAGIITRTGRR